MLIIGEVAVEESVARERFSCDLQRCKGACCTIEGGRGAPLLDEERDLIGRYLPVLRARLSARSLAVIDREGAVEGRPGSFATACIGHRDCVFVTYDGDIARCAIEAAWLAGEIPWRKPVSCHLFPLRYTPASGEAMAQLRYEAIPQCSPARDLGAARGTPLASFVGDAIVRRLGEAWHGELVSRCGGIGPDRTAAAGGTAVPDERGLPC